jgi:hypothetical protein
MRRIFVTTDQIEELRETGSVRAGMYLLINLDEEEGVYG